MWSLLLALLTVCNFVALVHTKNITTTYSANGPVVFETGGVDLSLMNEQTCRDQNLTLASTSVDGATVSFSFTGTAITLNCITDTDRGLYNIAVDGSNLKTVSGISSARSCTAIYSVTGLANVPHNFLLKAVKQSLLGMTNGTSAKFEFLSFEVTTTDDPTPTSNNSSPTTLTTPTMTDPPSSKPRFPLEAVAPIVISGVLTLAAITMWICV